MFSDSRPESSKTGRTIMSHATQAGLFAGLICHSPSIGLYTMRLFRAAVTFTCGMDPYRLSVAISRTPTTAVFGYEG